MKKLTRSNVTSHFGTSIYITKRWWEEYDLSDGSKVSMAVTHRAQVNIKDILDELLDHYIRVSYIPNVSDMIKGDIGVFDNTNIKDKFTDIFYKVTNELLDRDKQSVTF